MEMETTKSHFLNVRQRKTPHKSFWLTKMRRFSFFETKGKFSKLRILLHIFSPFIFLKKFLCLFEEENNEYFNVNWNFWYYIIFIF